MTCPIQAPATGAFRSSRLSRWRDVAAMLLATLLAGCGDGTGPEAPLPIAMSTAVRAYQVVEARLGAGAVTQAEVSGTLGTVAITASRLDDSTVAFAVPNVLAGPHTLSLSSGGKSYKATLQVQAAPAVANPAASLDSIGRRIDSVLVAHAAALEAPLDLSTIGGIDTAAVRSQLAVLRARVADFRGQVAALSPAEQAEVAAFFAANRHLLTVVEGSVASAGAMHALAAASRAAGSACTGGKACYDAVDKLLLTVIAGSGAALTVMHGAKVASWLGGVASKITAEGLMIVTAGVLMGYVMNEIATMTRSAVKGLLTGSAVSPALVPSLAVQQPVTLRFGEDLPTFRSGTPGPMVVTAEYRSLTAGDLASDPALSAVAASFRLFQDGFSAVASLIPFFDIPAPSFPASPLVRVVEPIPPSQLAIGTVSPAGFTAAASSSGANWMLTFANALQGRDHQVSFPVTFTPPGLPSQTASRPALVQPLVYRVASLQMTYPATTVSMLATLNLATIAKDSTGRAMTAAELGGRKPAWSTANAGIATVDADGVVTGKAQGTTRITAVLEGGRAELDVTVSASCDAGWVFGTWTATHGAWESPMVPLPGLFKNGNVPARIGSATITINADSSFSGTQTWHLVNSMYEGMYGPGGNPVGGYVTTRYTGGKLRISCTISPNGAKSVQLQTLAVETRMYNTGGTPAPQGYEGWGDVLTSNVLISQEGSFEQGVLSARLKYWPGIYIADALMRFTK